MRLIITQRIVNRVVRQRQRYLGRELGQRNDIDETREQLLVFDGQQRLQIVDYTFDPNVHMLAFRIG